MSEQPFTGNLKPGAKLGKYEVREQVAAGGMAIIYKAYDPTLDRYVAIKQIAPHLSQDERFTERFKAEAQTLARLSGSQANIVNVHELIEQDGQLFLIMEYVDGTTLRAMMDRGPVPLQTGLGVLLSTALGLRAMHAQAIVHRDLTPMNIMMARDGALKITDFGLIGHSGGRTSLPMGTTKYMAPEMFTGVPVDARADLYSLGFIAYEMFAGPEKFGDVFRDVLRDERARQVRWMHWHANPDLKAPPLKDIQPGIPPLISKIVERMMEKDASRRFASAEQIIRWLRRIFVMHVKGKSLSVSDSESLEREMEAEALAPRVPAVRGGALVAAPEAGGPPAETGKTAPLPVPKWTWKRAAFWASVTAGPLILIAAGLLIYNEITRAGIEKEARQALTAADTLFGQGQWAEARARYEAFKNKFRDLGVDVEHAHRQSQMAKAEIAFGKKQWDDAYDAVDDAERAGASVKWVHSFRDRLAEAMKVAEGIGEAKRAEQAGKYADAVGLITHLQASFGERADIYSGINLGEWVFELRYKQMTRDHQARLVDAKTAIDQRRYDDALKLLRNAQKIQDTPEVAELIQAVERRKTFEEWAGLGDRAAAEKKWRLAAAHYAKALEVQPSATIKAKMDEAKAEDLAGQARSLEAANLPAEAMKRWSEVLQYDPQHREALVAMKRYTLQKQLDSHIKAGDGAMRERRWDEALRSYESALSLMDPDDKSQKSKRDRVEAQLLEAQYRAPLSRGREAMERQDWGAALRELELAKSFKDTPEVDSLIDDIKSKREYYRLYNLAKELLSQSSFVAALETALTLQETHDTQEVRELVIEINYQRYKAKGLYYLRENEPDKARAWFKTAQGYKDTAEIQGLLQEANRLMESGGSE